MRKPPKASGCAVCQNSRLAWLNAATAAATSPTRRRSSRISAIARNENATASSPATSTRRIASMVLPNTSCASANTRKMPGVLKSHRSR
jgi:hypothetical protein